MNELAKIVGEVLNIHEEPISNENATIELSMKELLEICNKWKESGYTTNSSYLGRNWILNDQGEISSKEFGDETVVLYNFQSMNWCELPKEISEKIVDVLNGTLATPTDEQLIEIYDHYGASFFGKRDDKQLKQWGNSDEEIREAKIGCVKFKLNCDKDGVEMYKLLNKKCGGKNVL